eukprot:9160402-Pyramimonas_sp.AAC.1
MAAKAPQLPRGSLAAGGSQISRSKPSPKSDVFRRRGRTASRTPSLSFAIQKQACHVNCKSKSPRARTSILSEYA